MLLTLLTFFVVLSILILAHELGHFLAAKKMGIKVEEFGLGYPPRIWQKKIRGTVYSLNAVPFGGFVKLYGEEMEEQKSKAKNQKFAFWAKSKKARMVVITAGVLANFLLAVVCFSIVYSFVGIPTRTNKVKVIGVIPGSPAERAGIQADDLIIKVDDLSLTNSHYFIQLIAEKKGKQLKLEIGRGKENLVLWAIPREKPPEGEGPLGVIISDREIIKYPFWQMPVRSTIEGIKKAWDWTKLVVFSLKTTMVDLIVQGKIPKEVAGPLGIFQASGVVVKSGVLSILEFVGILSVNLAIVNILPFPALDGGRLIFVFYEAITRKKPKASIEHWVNVVGMAILLSLIVLVTINDIRRIIKTTSIATDLRFLWPF